jgi:hypothetical protein
MPVTGASIGNYIAENRESVQRDGPLALLAAHSFAIKIESEPLFHAETHFPNHPLKNGVITSARASGNSSWIDSFPTGSRLTLTLGSAERASISARDFAGV